MGWIAWAVGGGAGGVIALVLWQRWAQRRDGKLFPPPGKLIEAEGTRLHVLEAGTGLPAIVFEAGIAASSLSWRPLQAELAKTFRTVSYDRAGLGFSDASPRPRTLDQLVAELHGVVSGVALPKPFILAGHSFGGLVVRAYAARHPDDVAGLVLVDPVLPADWRNLSLERRRTLGYGAALSTRGAWLAQLGIVRLALATLMSGARFVPQAIARVASGKGSGIPERLVGEVRKLPPELWPVMKAQWCQPKSFRAMGSYLRALPESCESAGAWPASPKPTVIISAANASEAQRREWDRLAAEASWGRHVRARAAGHWVQFDEPDLILEAVHDLVRSGC